MDADKLFDALPRLFSGALKTEMMMGILPSETVETTLKPLLDNYDRVFPKLSREVRDDINDVMRIYPEIAEKYALARSTADAEAHIPETPLISKIKDVLSTLLWEPQWAGQPASAAAVPKQEHSFKMGEFGEIKVACYWKSRHNNNPAYIWVSWKADITAPVRLQIQFVDPQTHKILYQKGLENRLAGEGLFTSDELGFDPSQTRWAVCVIAEDA
ncbi:hypothetical protein QUF75_13890 [Desulfococcaceae bacterium HSG7]|nr:hypothetical protein [Desulfococcaceae bacterium HSG7]